MSISIIALLTADTKVIESIKPVVKDLVWKQGVFVMMLLSGKKG